MSRRQQISVYLAPEDYDLLRKLSKETRVPMQVYLREGLDEVLRRNKDQTVEKSHAAATA